MRKIGFLALILAMFYSGVALAQVAAPKLNPFELNGSGLLLTHPVNPAVTPWNGPSSFGGGVYDLELETTDTANPFTGIADGSVIQINLIGEKFGLSVESSSLTLEITDTNSGQSATLETKNTILGLGIRLGESYSIGLGQQASEFIDPFAGNTTKTLPMVGAVLKMGESFFIGGTYGTETVEKNVDNGLGVFTVGEAERVVSRVGLGFFSKGKENGFHIEIYQESTDLLEVFDQTGTNKIYVEDSSTTGLTLEVQFGNIFLGFEQMTREFTEVNVLASGYDEQEEVDSLITIGYAPMEGVQLVVSSITTEITNLINGNVFTLSGLFLGLGIAF